MNLGLQFRLPTEAEWEYACRAGTTTAYYFGNNPNMLGEYAWYNDNSNSQTHPVGQKKPNAWGLFDMHGNVYEWCSDWYGSYPSKDVTDYSGASSGDVRVLRGGSWYCDDGCCRSAHRYFTYPVARHSDYGLRLCSPLAPY